MRGINFSEISNYRSRLGVLLRLPLRAIPAGTVLPVLQGPLRGTKWITGSSSHGCWLGSYEFQKQRMFDQALPKGGIVWDLGSNVGFYSLLAARKSRSVLAVEPLPDNTAFIEQHLQLNRVANVDILRGAVSDRDGIGRFSPGCDRSTGKITDSGAIEVPVFSVRRLLQIYPNPELIKIDVEGAEFEVLHGGIEYLSSRTPILFLATHGATVHKACVELLRDIGYRIESIGTPDELLATAP